MKRTTPLKRTAFKTKPKKRKPRKTLEQKTTQELKREADKWFSRYVRLRDSDYIEGEWLGLCIDQCGRRITVLDREGKWVKGANLGHFVTRGHLGLRYDEFNCNLQGAWCNAWRDKESMITGYKKGLDAKYGTGTAARLVKQGKEIGKVTKQELLQIIEDSKTYIEYATSHTENYK